jgi:hypothetical protein
MQSYETLNGLNNALVRTAHRLLVNDIADCVGRVEVRNPTSTEIVAWDHSDR